MSIRMAPMIGVLALAALAPAVAQSPTDLTFTASGTHCVDVNWSAQTLKRHPRIAAACQGVVKRDGKYFVVFTGTVTQSARQGRELTVEFKDGDRVTLNPPHDMEVDIEGTMTPMRDLRHGQELTFYVPQDRFVAEVSEGRTLSIAIPILEWEPQPITYRAGAGKAMPELPKTATERGLLALAGIALMMTGAGLTAVRLRRRLR